MNAKCATLFPASGKWFTRTLVDRFVTVNQTIRRAGFQTKTMLLTSTKRSGPRSFKTPETRLDYRRRFAMFSPAFIYSLLDTLATASGGVIFCHRYAH
jgi:hypothetical protein